jgi:hypothetical protein
MMRLLRLSPVLILAACAALGRGGPSGPPRDGYESDITFWEKNAEAMRQVRGGTDGWTFMRERIYRREVCGSPIDTIAGLLRALEFEIAFSSEVRLETALRGGGPRWKDNSPNLVDRLADRMDGGPDRWGLKIAVDKDSRPDIPLGYTRWIIKGETSGTTIHTFSSDVYWLLQEAVKTCPVAGVGVQGAE